MNQILKLDSPVRFLKGVGPERSKLLEELGVQTLSDLLFFFPRRYENRAPIKKIAELEAGGEKECVAARVVSGKNIRTKSGKFMFRAVLRDAAGPARRGASPALFATWFNAPYLSTVFKSGARVILWGKAERSGNNFNLFHPEFEPADAGNSFHFGRIVPVYPLVEDLSQKLVRSFARAAVGELGGRLGDRLPEDRRRALRLPPLNEAVCAMHFPDSFDKQKQARGRIVFDEFLALQLAVGLRRAARRTHRPELSHARGHEAVAEFAGSLGFELTAGQKRAIDEILADMRRPFPMNRLLQADVGSGKTAVSAAAVLYAVSNGFQAAFMAPTEVLARQQMFSLSRDLEPFGVRLAYVGAGDTDPETLQKLAAGAVDAAVGTHALLEKRVRFKNLGLAVVDEQHKFGAAQRAALWDKGFASASKTSADGRSPAANRPHFLMLTATPIPRSLAMTFYGDLDISEIRERPAGRAPVRTARVEASGRDAVYAFLEKTVSSSGRAFVVCPLLSKGTSDAKNAVDVARELAARFPELPVACLHGKLKAAEKERLVRDFRSGKIKVLVCTVVIEVGIDVPDANVIVIENAERFGMAQLHQLRGRVGRGAGESYCFLVSGASEPESVERLDAFCGLSSGFEIAEKDLQLRGRGDFTGRRQHGQGEGMIGDFIADEAVLLRARREAAAMLAADPDLVQPRHRFLKRMVAGRFGAPAAAGAVSE